MSASMPVVIPSDQSTLPVGGNVAAGATDSGNPAKIGGKYNTSAPTLTNGQRGDIQLDASANVLVSLATQIAGEDIANLVLGVQAKPVASATYSALASTSFGTSTAISAKATPGNVKSITCSNTNAAVRFMQVHNKASAPASTEVPIFSFSIPAGTATAPGIREIGAEFLGDGGYFLSTGVAFGISTAAATYTAATAADHQFNATYV
jgi:hypothetical protein